MNGIDEICAEIQELMIPYLNHAITREETGRLVLHLAECKTCRKEMPENIKLHSKIKLSFNQIPPEIKIRAYDKINFAERKQDHSQSQSITDLIVDDIMTAAHAPILELYSKLVHSLISSPVNRVMNYTFSQINEIDTENIEND